MPELSIRKKISIGLMHVGLLVFVISCNNELSSSSLPATTSPTVHTDTTENGLNPPVVPSGSILLDQESATGSDYRNTAKKVMDLVGQTAPILSGTGLSIVFVNGDRSEAVGIAEAANSSFGLAKMLLNQNSAPDDLNEFHTAISESIDLYSSAAQVLTNLPDSEDFDAAEFQSHFQAAGAKFHEAGSLFAVQQE